MPREEGTAPRAERDDVRIAGLAFRWDRVGGAVVGLALVGLGLRLVGLGARPFHWDEARVGYWTLRYFETGAYRYRPIAGGPLLYLVGRSLFSLVGVAGWIARLPVAVLGAALPLAALFFRDRLDGIETVLFAAVLTFQPVVLYYSRFLRGDVPLAFFGLAFVGFALRAWDRRSRRDAYAAAVALPLAAAASGFVAGYLLCWIGAWALVVDQRSVAADGGASARRAVASLRDRLAGSVTPAARAGLLATGVTAFLFAPRAGPGVAVGLYDPTELPRAVYRGTVGALWRFVGVRVVNRFPEGTHPFIPPVVDAGSLLLAVALPVAGFALAATLWSRYAETRRPLVEGVGYWGLLGVVVFPTIAEVFAPWVLVHVVVPLSLPAAVGLAALLRGGVAATRDGGADSPTRSIPPDRPAGIGVDVGTVAAVALVVLAVVAQTGAVVAADVYGPSDRDNRLAQFAQPRDDLAPFAASAAAAADGDPSTVEVVYVGAAYRLPAGDDRLPPVGDAWGNRLPLPWYVASAGADSASAANVSVFAARYATPATAGGGTDSDPDSLPPIVVADPVYRPALSDLLGQSYEATTYHLGLWDREVVVFARTGACCRYR
ncbi:MAG: flippase activity-associated protein Agl23 [Haloquadratum sp.]